MFDLHCHFLPGIDDGPTDLADSLRLVRAAIADGVTHAVVTPHIHTGRWDNNFETISRAFNILRRSLEENKMPLQLGMAAEVRLDEELPQRILNHNIPFLGSWKGYQVLLLEMPHSHIFPGTNKIIDWLLSRDILPMIAHPERNKAVMKAPRKLVPFIEQGCLLQVTAGSLKGQFGSAAYDVARELLQHGLITVLASDAHNNRNRPPNLSEGYRAAKEIVGEKAALELVQDNPQQIFFSNSFIMHHPESKTI